MEDKMKIQKKDFKGQMEIQKKEFEKLMELQKKELEEKMESQQKIYNELMLDNKIHNFIISNLVFLDSIQKVFEKYHQTKMLLIFLKL